MVQTSHLGPCHIPSRGGTLTTPKKKPGRASMPSQRDSGAHHAAGRGAGRGAGMRPAGRYSLWDSVEITNLRKKRKESFSEDRNHKKEKKEQFSEEKRTNENIHVSPRGGWPRGKPNGGVGAMVLTDFIWGPSRGFIYYRSAPLRYRYDASSCFARRKTSISTHRYF